MTEILKERVSDKILPKGIEVLEIDFSSMRLPEDIMSSMGSVQVNIKLAEAKMIYAKNELETAMLVKSASDIYMESPIAMKLQYMEVLKKMCKNKHSKLVLPDSIIEGLRML